jgi:hypothetical protein
LKKVRVSGKHKIDGIGIMRGKGIKLKNIWYYRQIGLSFAQVGRICGCSKQAVWVRLKRFQNNILYDELSLKWMREILEKSSSTCRLP